MQISQILTGLNILKVFDASHHHYGYHLPMRALGSVPEARSAPHHAKKGKKLVNQRQDRLEII